MIVMLKFGKFMNNFNLIGAGRLGQRIAYALAKHTDFHLHMIYQRNRARAEQAIELLGYGQFVSEIEALSCTALTIITTSDDAISWIAQALAASQKLLRGSVVIHMSGSLNSDILAPLREAGCFVASFHPLKAFTDILSQEQDSLDDDFNGCDMVYEGDMHAIEVVKPLFEKLGACLIGISSEDKVLYHAGAVMASNYLVTLAAQGIELMAASGIDRNIAYPMVVRLMQTSLDNVRGQSRIERALTGPLARGDVDVIARHLHAIKNPITRRLYATNLLATLPLTALTKTKCDMLKKCVKDSL